MTPVNGVWEEGEDGNQSNPSHEGSEHSLGGGRRRLSCASSWKGPAATSKSCRRKPARWGHRLKEEEETISTSLMVVPQHQSASVERTRAADAARTSRLGNQPLSISTIWRRSWVDLEREWRLHSGDSMKWWTWMGRVLSPCWESSSTTTCPHILNLEWHRIARTGGSGGWRDGGYRWRGRRYASWLAVIDPPSVGSIAHRGRSIWSNILPAAFLEGCVSSDPQPPPLTTMLERCPSWSSPAFR